MGPTGHPGKGDTSPSRRHRQRCRLFHKGLSPRWVRLGQPLPGTLQHKPQLMQVVQTTAPAQRQPETILHKSPHRLPVPVGQSNARLQRQLLHRRPSTPLVAPRPTRGEPPVCSKTSALGPPSAKARVSIFSVIGLWRGHPAPGLRARPSAAAVQPWASNHTACHRSRSRGVGAR